MSEVENWIEDMQDSLSNEPSVGAFAPVVVAPSYNNAGTVAGIVRRVLSLDLPLIVVNDGSTDATAQILSDLAASDGRITVVTHARNRGKAAALRAAFMAASDAGYSHAVTIDTDGQLDPEQIPSLLSLARRTPHGLVIGQRDENTEDYPARSRIGRRVSNLFVWMQCGVRVADSQCGLRVYPLDFLREVRCHAGRFGFETEVITRAGWAGRPVLGAAVRCRYFPKDKAVSHFRPFIDSFRGVPMHLRLMLGALTPFSERRHRVGAAPTRPNPSDPVREPRGAAASPSNAFHPKNAPTSPLRRLVDWLNPMPAIRQLREDDVGRANAAAGLAIGAFIANLPAYGLQTAISLYAARKLHLHPLSVVAGSHLSTPPVGPVLVAAAITIGHLLLHAELPTLASYDVRSVGLLPMLRASFLEWAVGSVIMGLFSSWVTYLSARWLFRLAARDGTNPAVPAAG